MLDDREYLELLRNKVQHILSKSPSMESMPGLESIRPPDTLEPAAPPVNAQAESGQLEAVVRWYRPVLEVADDHFITKSDDEGDPRFVDPNKAASKELLAALEKNRRVLDPVLRSVGRIELTNNIQYPWVGTGWLIGSDLGSDIIVTNAHVGREFGLRSGEGYVFRPGVPNASTRQSARIDFREEVKGTSPREFPISEIIWISELPGLDMCLLRVSRTAGADRIDPPIQLITEQPSDDAMLAVVGYPGSNNGYDPAPFEKLFGLVTGNKRFSPGFYTGRRGGSVTYDCSTLPGSSGSVVLDARSGRAIGLHYAGTAFDTNYAVQAVDLAQIIGKRPWVGEAVSRHSATLGDDVGPAASGGGEGIIGQASAVTQSGASRSGSGGSDGALTFVVPLEITVRLGGSTVAASVQSHQTVTPPPRADRASAEAAAEKVRQHLLSNKSVLSVKADYLFRDGVITEDYGVIVGVAPGTAVDSASLGLGGRLDGVAISVETADPATIAEQMFAYQTEAFSGRLAKYQRKLTGDFKLDQVTSDMTILLHASPEAGWPVLREFLSETRHKRLTIGMYHMTAPHVVKAIKAIASRNDTDIMLTIDRQRGDAENPDDTGEGTKRNDIPERDSLDELERIAGNRFEWAPASLGAHGLFASAYHIKVAVWGDGERDASLFWLSSGNWQSSNQDPIEETLSDIRQVTPGEVEGYNREWHAVVTDKALARTFRAHLERDFLDNQKAAQEEAPAPAMFDVLVPIGAREEAPSGENFQVFPPKTIAGKIKVQPLLTPDNYPEIIAELISQAKERVLIENQSFNFWKNADSMPRHFLNIVKAVRDRQKKGLDVRIIFRSGFGKERDTLRQMKKFGLKSDPDHVRYFDKCHTKGFVIDDDIAVLGSQNITAAGVGPNRDASLVIWHKGANEYFAELFEYDWLRIARTRVRSDEGMAPMRLIHVSDEAVAPSGYRRISLAEFLGET
jgi:hypothetical protein